MCISSTPSSSRGRRQSAAKRLLVTSAASAVTRSRRPSTTTSMLNGAVRRSARNHASSTAGEASERMAAHFFPRPRHVAEETEAGQRVERPAVDLRKVDPARHGGGKRRDGGPRIGRHAEIARQQVHGPERQHAEHLVAAGERRNRGADAAVTAADDHGIVPADRRIGDRAAQFARRQQADVEALAVRLAVRT